MNKTTVIKILHTLPDEFSTEALIEKLLVVGEVENGMKEATKGKMISLQEAKRRFETK